MKKREELRIPEELRYTTEHVWVRPDGDAWLVGISDYAQDQLGEVAFVDLTAEGRHLGAGEEFGSVESVKSVNALYMPVAGTVLENNPALEDTPSLVNSDCYKDGWLIRIKADDAVAVDSLLDAAAYRKQLP